MGTHIQHSPVTAPTRASPVQSVLAVALPHSQRGPGAGCRSPGCQGLTASPGHPTENSTATAAPWEIYLGNLVGFWGSRPGGFSIVVLYDGRETKTLFPKVRPKVKAQALTRTPEQTVLGFGLAGKQEGEREKLPQAKLSIYTREREFTAKKIFYG